MPEQMDARFRGHSKSIGQRMERGPDALLPSPLVSYDACDRRTGRVSSLSLVRYRTNDYSVSVAYGHRVVLVSGYVVQVVIGCGAGAIASHPRSYERDDFVYDPIHYLPLLVQKIGAFDQAGSTTGVGSPRPAPSIDSMTEDTGESANCNREWHRGLIAFDKKCQGMT